MTIQDLGSLGELIAAIATVATLIYLAIQIRGNTRAMRAESRRTEALTQATITQPLVTDGEVARIFNAGFADFSSLSPEEQTRFSALLANFISADSVVFEEASMGIVPKQMLDAHAANLRAFLNTPGGRKVWARFRARYPQKFPDWVEREILTPSD